MREIRRGVASQSARVGMLQSAFAVLAASSSALIAVSPMPLSTRKCQQGHVNKETGPIQVQRTSKIVAQNGWHYYNERTGQSQWAPRHDMRAEQGYGAQHVWRVFPTAGVYSEYAVRSCEEQVLGRFDMIEQSVYVSRQQCVVRVAADGTATLLSIGKPPTLFRAHAAAPWYVRRQSEHVLSDGEQISLDVRYPESAVFTITSDAQYRAQYSEDGGWMWNGMEWIPASLPRRIAVV